MKKILSIFLAVLMTVMCIVPSFAEEAIPANGEPDGDTTDKILHEVVFTPPSANFKDGYVFAKTEDGEPVFEPDPDGEYCFYNGRYMLPENVWPEFRYEISDDRFSPVIWEAGVTYYIEDGETLAFKVLTSEKYNVLTATVVISGNFVSDNANDEYAVKVYSDLNIRVAEYDDKGEEALLRNYFMMKLTSGDGYAVMPARDENYHVVYYGDDYRFRVEVLEGYSASGIEVSVQRGGGLFEGLLEEEDLEMINGIIGEKEILTAEGIDEDGYRIYRVKNITSDCIINVDNVKEASTVGLMTLLKRIVRLILDFLNIKLDILDSFISYNTVTVDNIAADNGVSYKVLRSTSEKFSPTEFTVTNGDGISIIVTKQSLDQEVVVSWTPGNENGKAYTTHWNPEYDPMTDETTYSAIYNIDNITADMSVVIY